MISERHVRALYNSLHRLGADRICYTASKQVLSLAATGVDTLLYVGSMALFVREVVKTHQ